MLTRYYWNFTKHVFFYCIHWLNLIFKLLIFGLITLHIIYPVGHFSKLFPVVNVMRRRKIYAICCHGKVANTNETTQTQTQTTSRTFFALCLWAIVRNTIYLTRIFRQLFLNLIKQHNIHYLLDAKIKWILGSAKYHDL